MNPPLGPYWRSAALVAVSALVVSCGKREREEASWRPPKGAVGPAVEDAVTHGIPEDVPQDVADMPDVAGVVAALLSLETPIDSKPSPFAIREALVRLSEKSGISFGECVRQVHDAAIDDASEEQVKRRAKYLAGIGLGDQDLLLSMLEASAPGPMLESMGGVALGSAFRKEGYDLAEIYKAMPEAHIRNYVASTWVSRTWRNDGLAAALVVLDSLETTSERRLSFMTLHHALKTLEQEGRPVREEDISALLERGRNSEMRIGKRFISIGRTGMTRKPNILRGAGIAAVYAAGLASGWLWFGNSPPHESTSSGREFPPQAVVRPGRARDAARHAPDSPDTTRRFGLSGVLAKGPEAIKDALDGAETSGMRHQAMNGLFNEAAHVARASGDFGLLADLFGAVGQNERLVLAHSLPAVFSKLGPSHDLAAKLGILEQLSVPGNSLDDLRRRILTQEAMERYEEMQREGVIGKLTPGDFAHVCAELGGVRLAKAFERVADGGSEEARRAAASALGRRAMTTGPMAGSEVIAKLPPGVTRDEAVAEMVLWLERSGSDQEAQPWLEMIEDAQAKARASQ